MSEGCEPGFAHIRKPETEAIKSIGQPSAGTVWMAIRVKFREGKPFACGGRDFADWGVGRAAAEKALRAFVEKNLLRKVKDGAFGLRGNRAQYEFVHTRAGEITARKTASGKPDTARKTTTIGSKNGQPPEITARKTATPLEALRPSASEPKDEGALVDDCSEDRAALRRTIRLAGELQLPLMGLVRTAGSPNAARALALRWERERAPLSIVRDWLADSPVEQEIRVQSRFGRVAIDGHEGHAATNGALRVTPRTIGAAA